MPCDRPGGLKGLLADNDLLILPETWLYNVPNYLQGPCDLQPKRLYSFGYLVPATTLELYRHRDIKRW